MRKILIIFLVIILILVSFLWKNTNQKIVISSLIKKGNIHTGNLKYRIYLLGILPIGEADFAFKDIEEYDGQRVYHLNATAEPLRFFARVFKGYAILDSYVDMQELSPLLFRQRIEGPGGEDRDRQVLYDQKNGIVSIDGIRRKVFPNTQDPLSLTLNIMRMDFEKVRTFEMNINTNQKNYILEAIAEPKVISMNNKIYKTILLKAEIKRRDKNPYHRSSISMVLWQDKENIPILVKVFASGILINAKLIDIK